MAHEQHEDVVFVPEERPKKVDDLAQEVEQLQEDIKADLQDLKGLTGDSRAWFWRGIMQGAGAILGSIIMLILLGWLLSVIGVIPGFGEIAEYVGGYLEQVRR